MNTLHVIFSPSGRLSPRPFMIAAIAVYAAGIAAQWLTVPEILTRAGIWPFGAVQAVLIWIWYVLHAKRLHDAGRSVAPAIAASLLYALSVVLLLILAISFYAPMAAEVPDANTASALGLILFVAIVAMLGTSHYDLTSVVVAILVLLSFLPVILAVGVTVWAATRPSVEGRPA